MMIRFRHYRWNHQALRQEHGQSLVEMVLVIMLFLSLVGGIVDFGTAFHRYIIITNAARTGTREAARLPCKSDNKAALKSAIINAAINEAAGSSVTLTSANITIKPDPVTAGCPAPGATVQVTVTLQYSPIFSAMIGVGQFSIANTVYMAYSGNDQL